MSRPARTDHYAKATSLGASERLLGTVWALEDVPDVELLCRGVLSEVRPRQANGQQDTLANPEEAMLFLFEQVVVMRGRYRPREHPGILFRPWLYTQLRFRLRDFYRHLEGRRGEKPRPDSLERPIERGNDEAWVIDPVDPLDRDDHGARRLGESLAERQVGSEEARSDALLRFLGDAGGEVLREDAGLGDGADEAPAGRDPRPSEDDDREEIAA